jgi:hypothetical protein
VNHHIGANVGDQAQNAFAIANVEVKVLVIGDAVPEPLKRPSGISFGPKEYSSFVVVDAMNTIPVPGEVNGNL